MHRLFAKAWAKAGLVATVSARAFIRPVLFWDQLESIPQRPVSRSDSVTTFISLVGATFQLGGSSRAPSVRVFRARRSAIAVALLKAANLPHMPPMIGDAHQCPSETAKHDDLSIDMPSMVGMSRVSMMGANSFDDFIG